MIPPRPYSIPKSETPLSSNGELKSSKRDVGRSFEDRAGIFLREQGLELLERNVFYRVGEIDWIVCDRETLIFVEVRFRSPKKSRETPIQSLGYGKLYRLRRAIELYLQKNSKKLTRYSKIRVDALAFTGETEVEWMKGIQI